VTLSVIPGRAEGANPESTRKLGVCFWIRAHRFAVPRNDSGEPCALDADPLK